jgi:hypothetical protein
VIWTLPNKDTCETSMSLVESISSPLRVISTRPSRLPTVVPCSVTYSGRGEGSLGSSRRGGRRLLEASRFTSSGRQMPTSEHLGHFGLSTRGGGGRSRPATSRNRWRISRVLATSSSSKGTMTRRLAPAKYRTPSLHEYPASRSSSPWTQSWTRSGSHERSGVSGGAPRLVSMGLTSP